MALLYFAILGHSYTLSAEKIIKRDLVNHDDVFIYLDILYIYDRYWNSYSTI